ncbi:unnamed protein product [Rotaria magnacalcarata]|uniref:Reverse transcriptase domain-containing protein n=2 Tax=Rotaria magnacalcarata TaxID=392030 RepID=A0A816MEQ3_9BILA|nr:unnamed protein product [Rotaria magnacalcarata]
MKSDGTKAEALFTWTDTFHLAPFLLDEPTSQRSERVIDFALSNGHQVAIHTCKGNTTSDPKPTISIIPIKYKENSMGHNTHWKRFTLFPEYIFDFWGKRWNLHDLDNEYITFIFLLISRCTINFPLKKYRIAIPKEIRVFLSYVRARSFRQLKSRNTELYEATCKLKKQSKAVLRLYLTSQFNQNVANIYKSSNLSVSFWSKTKKFFKLTSTSLHGFILPDRSISKNPETMTNIAANYYEDFFKKHENIIKPHPYTDAPWQIWENEDEAIPEVETLELIDIVNKRSKKRSCDAHGLSNFMFRFLPSSYWSLLKNIYNWSFSTAITPSAWKDVRMLLLAKKDPICTPSATRPISLLDVFLKINEKVFLTRFQNIINKRGLLPDTQSGFREKFRLQTRMLLFLEQVLSMMANSTPVATIFADFKTAFDQLWFEGCIGKLKRMGIPTPFLKWINNWLLNRRAYVEIQGRKSRWFHIHRGGPQGSILTPTVFITYHSDMTNYINMASSYMFADDLAAVVSGRIGEKYSLQYLDLEHRLKSLLDALEFYAILSIQPINYEKTVGLWSACAIGGPKFCLHMGDTDIRWAQEFKCLGY